ncbi:MAG TPA: diaminopimelate epimerase [Fimbriimonadaceae bacterium]|nr:diaminopimelate epimerase [Fimbriimonadaceae bacterium]
MIPFTKMHGLGNDFVFVDGIRQNFPEAELPELSRILNDRKFGVGGDGLILAWPGTQEKFRMRMFNPDGSEGGMCGNGVRCFAPYLIQEGHLTESSVLVEVADRIVRLDVLDEGRVRVDMGTAGVHLPGSSVRWVAQEIEAAGHVYEGTAVWLGNPHLVIFCENADCIDLARIGPVLETHPLFPERTNVHFAHALDRLNVLQRTWERGAGITLACGSGACACAVAAVETGRSERVMQVHPPGGTLEIEYADSGRVYMTGQVETVFRGIWERELSSN